VRVEVLQRCEIFVCVLWISVLNCRGHSMLYSNLLRASSLYVFRTPRPCVAPPVACPCIDGNPLSGSDADLDDRGVHVMHVQANPATSLPI
jgi:hypothetical protein